LRPEQEHCAKMALTDMPELRKAAFWSQVSIARRKSDCWTWNGARTKDGYGLFSVDGRSVPCTHISWSIINSDNIPQGLIVCHSCDNPSCVSPHHLWLGTHLQNTDDMFRKGRARMRGKKRKLTEAEAVAIFADQRTYREIGDQYNVSAVAVWGIKHGHLHRHATKAAA